MTYLVALFISGRLTCYEENLIPVLEHLDKNYIINLFICINGKRDDYHIIAEEKLKNWLKSIEYEEYKIPQDFSNNHPETLFQIVEGVKQPFTNLSCFYNDKKAFNLIMNFEEKENIKHDIYCKFRPDLIFQDIEKIIFKKDDENEFLLHSCIPHQPIYFPSVKTMCISDAFAYGNKLTMKLYTQTYDYILKKKN